MSRGYTPEQRIRICTRESFGNSDFVRFPFTFISRQCLVAVHLDQIDLLTVVGSPKIILRMESPVALAKLVYSTIAI